MPLYPTGVMRTDDRLDPAEATLTLGHLSPEQYHFQLHRDPSSLDEQIEIMKRTLVSNGIQR